jgi:hypothetical protein
MSNLDPLRPEPGPGPNRTDALARVVEERDRTVKAMQAVMENPDLLAEAKRRRLDELAAQFDETRTAGRAEHQAELVERRAKLERYAFGPGGTANLAAWREAASQAAEMDSEDQAVVALAVARRAGDQVWARGLASTAYERGWGRVLAAYVGMRPEAAEALREAAAMNDRTRRLQDDMAFSSITVPQVPDHGSAESAAERVARGWAPLMRGRERSTGSLYRC